MGATDEVFKAPFYMAAGGIEWRRFGVSASLGYMEQANKVNTLLNGRLTLIPMMLNGYVRVPLTKKLKFKGGGGISYVEADQELDDSILKAQDLKAFKIKNHIKSNLANQAYGGFDYSVSPNVIVGLDVYYLFFKTRARTETDFDGKRSHENSVYDRPVDLSGIIGTLTVKYKW